MFNINNNGNLKKVEEAKAEAKKEEEYEKFLNTLFEEIYKKYGFYRSSKL
jgi:hypothetical protein